ncbi:MAG: hypothetical protein LUE12_07360 [Ruminococcus sp.]|nr:hypothetical protein [Ruminococcus sp.]
MQYLSFDNVKEIFLRTTGVSEDDFEHSQLLENAEDFVLSHLSVSYDELTSVQVSLCEYAAAAVAVYDYSFELYLRQQAVMSESGEVTLTRADKYQLEASGRMRSNALKQLYCAEIAEPKDFAFIKI